MLGLELICGSYRPPWPVFHRLRQVRPLDLLTASQVANRPRQLEDAASSGEFVVGSGAHLQLLHGGAKQAPAGLVKLAVLAYLAGAYLRLLGSDASPFVGVGQQAAVSLEALPLALPAASTRAWMMPVLAEQGRGLAQAVVRQLSVRPAETASTRGTSMWMSSDRRPARSSRGPEIRRTPAGPAGNG